MKQSTFHGQLYEKYTWDELGTSIFQLAKQIIESGEEFDRVIALAKGGLAFSKSVVDYLGVKEISSLQVQFYTGIGEVAQTPVITQSLPVSIRNERILLFDDLVDRGETMKIASQYLSYHGAKSMKTAVLLKKPWSTFDVDYVVHETESWVIFPNEIRETISTLVGMWGKKGDSPALIKKQLQQIGFSKDEIALFANLE